MKTEFVKVFSALGSAQFAGHRRLMREGLAVAALVAVMARFGRGGGSFSRGGGGFSRGGGGFSHGGGDFCRLGLVLADLTMAEF